MNPIESDLLQLLPKRTAELVGVIGLEPALILVKQFGGTHLWIPRTPQQFHQLSTIIGIDAFKKLCSYYAGTQLEVDLCAALLRAIKNQMIAAEFFEGMTNAQLARKYQTTERQIRRIKQKVKGSQPLNFDLFK